MDRQRSVDLAESVVRSVSGHWLARLPMARIRGRTASFRVRYQKIIPVGDDSRRIPANRDSSRERIGSGGARHARGRRGEVEQRDGTVVGLGNV